MLARSFAIADHNRFLIGAACAQAKFDSAHLHSIDIGNTALMMRCIVRKLNVYMILDVFEKSHKS
jgi:hypothetical protein